ncbi:subgroup A Rous sarcoma virus receptor pg950 [Procambarus clarkii]|uniref:subgroup A Rous sarcoma virus receptor pg950 n=1 Tax=Procambarus clarkii TaxID=6728 RepID=UPI001E6751FF|nr:subgroup A Rous sarcoma virus receptor pg950-like [Procambarus clarkii]XP_045586054.1 subgroup A Rous sarcoma virus receptor pg950-like [Procambarus clarkii]
MTTCTILLVLLLAAVGPLSAAETKCEGKDFNCGDKCIPPQFVCDGFFDCGNGRDEVNCKEKSPAKPPPPGDLPPGADAPTFPLEFGR